MEDNLNGRRHKWKTASLENDLNEGTVQFSASFCQAQSQHQLNWTELALILFPPAPTCTYFFDHLLPTIQRNNNNKTHLGLKFGKKNL
jgi:hypothetical protein